MAEGQGIQVLVRVRPPNERERSANRFCVEVDAAKKAVVLSRCCLVCCLPLPLLLRCRSPSSTWCGLTRSCVSASSCSRVEGKTAQYVYDHVAGRDSSQADVFDNVGLPMCESVLQGYNATIFAYGQTGAGKTFTMMGSDSGTADEEDSRGLVQRVFDCLFQRIDDMKSSAENVEVQCKCSYLEIYNEQVTDLLCEGAVPIVIRDDPKKGVIVDGATHTVVKSTADTLAALNVGQQNRRVAATCMNKESSRSHCVFTLYLQTSTASEGVTRRCFSRFNLIDLAGSERQKQTQATGDRLKEANNINRSLSALGNVIMSLANNNGHVPYRDSKLTFMLKDSIGGNSKTCIIACCSPADMCYDETQVVCLCVLNVCARGGRDRSGRGGAGGGGRGKQECAKGRAVTSCHGQWARGDELSRAMGAR